MLGDIRVYIYVRVRKLADTAAREVLAYVAQGGPASKGPGVAQQSARCVSNERASMKTSKLCAAYHQTSSRIGYLSYVTTADFRNHCTHESCASTVGHILPLRTCCKQDFAQCSLNTALIENARETRHHSRPAGARGPRLRAEAVCVGARGEQQGKQVVRAVGAGRDEREGRGRERESKRASKRMSKRASERARGWRRLCAGAPVPAHTRSRTRARARRLESIRARAITRWCTHAHATHQLHASAGAHTYLPRRTTNHTRER